MNILKNNRNKLIEEFFDKKFQNLDEKLEKNLNETKNTFNLKFDTINENLKQIETKTFEIVENFNNFVKETNNNLNDIRDKISCTCSTTSVQLSTTTTLTTPISIQTLSLIHI